MTVRTYNTGWANVYADLPRGNKYAMLYINGKRQLGTYQHVPDYSSLLEVLTYWEQTYELDNVFVAVHILHKNDLRTFARIAPGEYFES